MKKTKKLFAMLMILCMLVPLFGISALAADKMTNDPGSAKQWGMRPSAWTKPGAWDPPARTSRSASSTAAFPP